MTDTNTLIGSVSNYTAVETATTATSSIVSYDIVATATDIPEESPPKRTPGVVPYYLLPVWPEEVNLNERTWAEIPDDPALWPNPTAEEVGQRAAVAVMQYEHNCRMYRIPWTYQGKMEVLCRVIDSFWTDSTTGHIRRQLDARRKQLLEMLLLLHVAKNKGFLKPNRRTNPALIERNLAILEANRNRAKS